MSPQLKQLVLPQLVEERRRLEMQQQRQHSPETDFSSVFYTAANNNSSSSDLATPLTPTFSARGHFRLSSSNSSLELPPQLQESPASPTAQPQGASKTSKHQLEDVQEEPMERDAGDTLRADQFDLYDCLCDGPCHHVTSSAEDIFPGDIIGDFDMDYDIGFLSDGDLGADWDSRRKRGGTDSPFATFTSRFGSRFPTMKRWASNRRTNLMSSPTAEVSFENVLSRGPSSRSSSISAPMRHMPERFMDPHMPPNPEMSYHSSTESVHPVSGIDIDDDSRKSLERDRALATTPLLPPLLTDPLAKPPVESPLQSPTVAPSSVVTEFHSPLPSSTSAQFPRPSLSTRPSMTSLRNGMSGTELPLPLPAILQEYDEWSDRLGHANFTITPLPYEPESFNLENLVKFREDWDAARINYTRHLVRTGENYGQTSKIYALTEGKWAETEKRWNSIYGALEKQIGSQSNGSSPSSRSRSRGRARGRSGSLGAAVAGRPGNDDEFAAAQWRRLEDGLPSAVPQMLEALDAEGKFPSRGDEDIVGPMHRDVVMVRTQSEEGRGAKFWRNLAEKVGIRK